MKDQIFKEIVEIVSKVLRINKKKLILKVGPQMKKIGIA